MGGNPTCPGCDMRGATMKPTDLQRLGLRVGRRTFALVRESLTVLTKGRLARIISQIAFAAAKHWHLKAMIESLKQRRYGWKPYSLRLFSVTKRPHNCLCGAFVLRISGRLDSNQRSPGSQPFKGSAPCQYTL
jgi:hypothetical protein